MKRTVSTFEAARRTVATTLVMAAAINGTLAIPAANMKMPPSLEGEMRDKIEDSLY